MMNDNQDCRQNEYHLFNAGHYAGPLSESDCSSSFFLYEGSLSKVTLRMCNINFKPYDITQWPGIALVCKM